MNVIIAGPRDLNLSVEEVQYCVDQTGLDVTFVVEGGATGVDRSAYRWAVEKLGKDKCKRILARWAFWKEQGNVGFAGPERNRRMARHPRIHALIAIVRKGRPITSGTSSMIAEAVLAGLIVKIVEV